MERKSRIRINVMKKEFQTAHILNLTIIVQAFDDK